jgi:hypothetical protein
MATKNAYTNQIENRNFLSPIGFKFILSKAPKVAFFSNQATIPGIDLGTAVQPSYLKDIDQPGDKLRFEDFTLRFMVDENLENYMEIQNWMRGLGFPQSLQQIYDLQLQNPKINAQNKSMDNIYSDGTLQILTSNNNPNFKIKFNGLFPVSLSSLNFDASLGDVEYFTAEAIFKYTIYNITDLNGDPL